jgi:radical SAM superfamily enzyme
VRKKMKCKHNFVDADNDGCYGKERCIFCGDTKNKDTYITDKQIKKETIKIIKRHLQGLTKAVEKLEKE